MKSRLPVALGFALVVALAVAGGVVVAAGRLDGSASAVNAAEASQGKVASQQAKLLAKVAEKLGLDGAQVSAAHDAARLAISQEERKIALDGLVESGRLTREQADQLGAWLDTRPAALDKVRGLPGLPGLSFGLALPGAGRVLPGGASADEKKIYEKMAAALGKDASVIEKAFKDARADLAASQRADAVNEALDRLVKDGVITDLEAAALREWAGKAPGFLTDGSLGIPGALLPPIGLPGGKGEFRFDQRRFFAPGVPPQGGSPRGFRFFQGPGGEQEFDFFGPEGMDGDVAPFRFFFGDGREGLPFNPDMMPGLPGMGDGQLQETLREWLRQHRVDPNVLPRFDREPPTRPVPATPPPAQGA